MNLIKGEALATRLRLPPELHGKRFLDLKCGDGSLCLAAVKRGAAEVVGVTDALSVLEQRQLEAARIELLVGDWRTLPTRPFDYIVLGTDLHFEPNWQSTVECLLPRLTQGGTFILECGLIWNLTDKDWKLKYHEGRLIRYPTARMLLEDVLRSFAVRDVAPPIYESGNPVPHCVFHCKALRPTIIAIGGQSHAGKTVLARTLARKGLRVMHSDFLFGEMRSSSREATSEFVNRMRPFLKGENNVVRIVEFIVREDLVERYCEFVMDNISPTEQITVVEGYPFSQQQFQTNLRSLARRSGFKFSMLDMDERI